jgi:hypothetical protein
MAWTLANCGERLPLPCAECTSGVRWGKRHPRTEEDALVYVLIIMLAGSGSSVGSVEFNTKDACEAAAKAIANAGRPYAGASAITVCVAKG